MKDEDLTIAQREAFKAGARVKYHKGNRFTDEALNAEAEKLFPWPAHNEDEVWTTAQGVRVHVRDMDDEHLNNTIEMIRRYQIRQDEWNKKLPALKKEQLRRVYTCSCSCCRRRT